VSVEQLKEFFEYDRTGRTTRTYSDADSYKEFLAAYTEALHDHHWATPQSLIRLLTDSGSTLHPEGFGALTIVPVGDAEYGLSSLVFFDGQIASHTHKQTASDILVLAGSGSYELGNDHFDYGPRSQIYIPPGSVHGFQALSPTVFMAKESYGSIVRRSGELGDTTFTDAGAQHAYDSAVRKSHPQANAHLKEETKERSKLATFLSFFSNYY